MFPKCPNCRVDHFVRISNVPATSYFMFYICVHCNTVIAVKKEVKQMNTYIIVRDPFDVTDGDFAPRKTYDSLEQATKVASEMTLKYRKAYFVAKLVKKVSLNEVKVEDV